MKKVLIHPYTLLLSFSLLLISGESFGGFYILYLVMGSLHGILYSIIGISGIIVLLFNKIFNNQNQSNRLQSLINILGAVLMILSLFIFFKNDSNHYNIATFYQLVPQIFLSLFIILSFSFIVKNIYALFKSSRGKK